MARLQRYVEVYTDVIAPSHRAFADVTMRSRHLCDFPEQKAMAAVFVLSGLDWSTADPVANWFNMQIVHAQAWTPLLKRFTACELTREVTPHAEWRAHWLAKWGVATRLNLNERKVI